MVYGMVYGVTYVMVDGIVNGTVDEVQFSQCLRALDLAVFIEKRLSRASFLTIAHFETKSARVLGACGFLGNRAD